jgi:hypothetical protein
MERPPAGSAQDLLENGCLRPPPREKFHLPGTTPGGYRGVLIENFTRPIPQAPGLIPPQAYCVAGHVFTSVIGHRGAPPGAKGVARAMSASALSDIGLAEPPRVGNPGRQTEGRARETPSQTLTIAQDRIKAPPRCRLIHTSCARQIRREVERPHEIEEYDRKAR